jgi:hypothetical protein
VALAPLHLMYDNGPPYPYPTMSVKTVRGPEPPAPVDTMPAPRRS